MKMEGKIFSLLGSLEGDIGLYFEDLQSEEKFTINSDNVFPAASVIKIPLVGLLMKMVEEGKINLDDEVRIKDENRVEGTGIIKTLNKNYQPTVLDLAKLAINVSDNVATNELIDLVGGPDRVSEFSTNLGLEKTKLQRKMLDTEAMKAGKDNLTSPRDIGYLLKKLARKEVVSELASKQIVEIMKSQQFRQKLPALIPALLSYDPDLSNEEVLPGRLVVANKTGDLIGVQNDVGIFIMPGNRIYVLAIFTKNLSEDHKGIQAIAEISKVIYEEMSLKYS